MLNQTKRLEADLQGLFGNYALKPGETSNDVTHRQVEVAEKLSGVVADSTFRTNFTYQGRKLAEVHFHNRELLTRYCSLTTPDQEALIRAILSAFEQTGNDEIRLVIQWSPKKKRVMKVKGGGNNTCLDVYLEPENMKLSQ